MLHSILGPVISHLARIFGLFPLSLNPDLSGSPVFSKCWCYYSFLLLGLFSFLTIQDFFTTTEPMFVVHSFCLYLYFCISYITNWFACKSGNFSKIIQNFADFEKKVKYQQCCTVEIVLYFLMTFSVVMSIAGDVYYAYDKKEDYNNYYTVVNILIVISEMLLWMLICSMQRRIKVLNSCLKQCALRTAWTLNRVEIISERQDLYSKLKIIGRLYPLLMDNVSLIKSSFQLQIIAGYGLLYLEIAIDSFSMRVQEEHVMMYYLDNFPWTVTVISRLLFITWITYSLKLEIQKSNILLTRIICSRMSASVRQGIKTLKLSLTHQPAKLSFMCFFNLKNFLSVVDLLIINFLTIVSNYYL